MRIGIDLMGGDQLPASLYDSLLASPVEGVSCLFFAHSDLERELSAPPAPHQLHFSPHFLLPDENPLLALRRKGDATLFTGLKALAAHEIDAFLTGGNTGGLVAGAHAFLPMFPGVHRPALLAFLPHLKGELAVIDVGAMLSPKAEHLYQFAKLGVATTRILTNHPRPRVALLNVGEESHKGTEQLKRAHRMMEEWANGHFTFLGNREARDVFRGEVDVLVTEGFAGNIFLKTAEGLGSVLLSSLTTSEVSAVFDYQTYPGAILCGVDGLVMKCHGSASTNSWQATLKKAATLLKTDFVSSLREEFATYS